MKQPFNHSTSSGNGTELGISPVINLFLFKNKHSYLQKWVGGHVDGHRVATHCDFIGNDIASYANIGLEECIERCKHLVDCSYFTWNQREPKCYLKYEAGQKGRPYLSQGDDFCGGWWDDSEERRELDRLDIAVRQGKVRILMKKWRCFDQRGTLCMRYPQQ